MALKIVNGLRVACQDNSYLAQEKVSLIIKMGGLCQLSTSVRSHTAWMSIDVVESQTLFHSREFSKNKARPAGPVFILEPMKKGLK